MEKIKDLSNRIALELSALAVMKTELEVVWTKKVLEELFVEFAEEIVRKAIEP